MSQQEQSVTVITRSKIKPSGLARFLEVSESSLPIFKKQRGFEGLEFYLSLDQSEAATVLHWASVADHENCFRSPDFAKLNPIWESLMKNGELDFSLQVYHSRERA